MRRPAFCVLVLLVLGAAPAGAATWHSQQPPGSGGTHPLLGEVGDVSCWNGEANRCLLIGAGNGGVPAGVFAYDGSGWYRYSTVCGGHEGRIAWAGPNEFWTISDQQPGQAFNGSPTLAYGISLCHFKDGRVVASYGEPIGVANSYRQMDAAACSGPSDCWFGGRRLAPETSVNPGAFHLHWDGAAVTAVPSQTNPAQSGDPGRKVSSLAYHRGSFYEGVDVASDDAPSPLEEQRESEEPGTGTSLLHRIISGSSTPFQPLFGSEPFGFGPFTTASELDGFLLTGSDDEDLWAVAGSLEGPRVTVLRLGPEGLRQLHLEDEAGILGSETPVLDVAAEPGADAAWIAFRRRGDSPEFINQPVRLVRVAGDGSLGPEVQLPLAGDESSGEPVGLKGVAGAIACPAVGQCWLATRRGWLFHLGPDPAPQNDPALHTLVTSRPPDNSLPVLPPLELPEDDSGLNEAPSSQEELPSQAEELPRRKPALLSQIKQRLVDGAVLELGFSLSAQAKVQMVAKLEGRVVAKTKARVFAKGRHSLRLRLDPQRWPNDIDLRATPLKRKGAK